jgi:hypothetical protein
VGKLLARFRPLEGYVPEEPYPLGKLPPAITKALGAPSLDDYFALSLKGKGSPAGKALEGPRPGPPEGARALALPRGTDSIGSATAALDATIAAYEEAIAEEPLPEWQRLRLELLRIRNAIAKAGRLLPALEEAAAAWGREAELRHKEAKEIAGSVAKTLSAAPGKSQGLPSALKLTAYASTLGEALGEASDLKAFRDRWESSLGSLLSEEENLLAAVSLERDGWQGALPELALREAALEKEDKELAQRAAECRRRLSKALGDLEAAERRLTGDKAADFLGLAEDLSRGLEAALGAVLDRRQALARLWCQVPRLVGRPMFLQMTFLSAAVNLGLAQGLLEEGRGGLSGFLAAASSTRRVREEAGRLLQGAPAGEDPSGRLALSKRRLKALDNARKRLGEAGGLKLSLENSLRAQKAIRREYRRLKERKDDEIGELGKRLSALSAEKDRLQETLSEAQRGLTDAGLRKSELQREAKEAGDRLASLEEGRKALQEELLLAKDSLAGLRRRHKTMTDRYEALTRKLSDLEDGLRAKDSEREDANAELGRHLEEKALLKERIEALSKSMGGIAKEREEKDRQIRDTAQRLDDAKATEAALRVALGGKEAKLEEASKARERMASLIAGFRLEADRITVAHNALRKSWQRRGALIARGQNELGKLSMRLDRRDQELADNAARLQELRAELGEAQGRAQSLEEARRDLAQQIGDARKRLSESDLTAKRLSDELRGLSAMKGSDLSPLINVLAIALSISEREKERQKGKVRELAMERLAAEATIRVGAAAREADYLDYLDGQEKEILKLREDNQTLEEELRRGRGMPGAPDAPGMPPAANASQGAPPAADGGGALLTRLAYALAAMAGEGEGLRQRLAGAKEEGAVALSERDELARRLSALEYARDQLITRHQNELAELRDLVSFFLGEGRLLWAGSPGGVPAAGQGHPMGAGLGDTGAALVLLMRRELAAMAAELETAKAERQELGAERVLLVSMNDELRERLATLGPLLSSLISMMGENALSLSRAYAERDRLSLEAERLKEALPAGPSEPLGLPPAAGPEDPMAIPRLRAEAARLSEENLSLAGTAERQRAELASVKAAMARLEEERAGLAGKASQDISMDAPQAASIDASKDAPKDAPAIEAVPDSGQGIEDTRAPGKAPADAATSGEGRVETAWAAFNYLVGKAGGAMGRLESQLDRQARELEDNFAELRQKDRRIKELESQGDQLALIYWTVLGMASKGSLAGSPAGEKEPNGGEEGGSGASGEGASGSGGSPEGSESSGSGGSMGALDKEGMGGLSALILRGVRKAARKTLFALLLGGGLMLIPPADAVADEPENGRRAWAEYRPDQREAPGAFLAPGGNGFPGPRVTVVQTRMPSSALGRTVDLGFLPPGERDLELTEADRRCSAALRAQAESLGLSLEEWASIVRLGTAKDQTVYLSDIGSPKSLSWLLQKQLPNMSAILPEVAATLPPGCLSQALRHLSSMRSPEGLFWDRLYDCLLLASADRSEAAQGALMRLARRSRLGVPRAEYVGDLRPIRDLEGMPHEKAVAFLASHIRDWGMPKSKRPPKGSAPEWLATDLYNASGIFRLPLTFLTVAARQHLEAGGHWPTALDVYAGSRALVGLVCMSSRDWRRGTAPICDLGETAHYFPVSQRNPHSVMAKYQNLVMAFRAHKGPGGLFPGAMRGTTPA